MSLKIFLTEFRFRGTIHEGPNIVAESFEDAEEQAEELGLPIDHDDSHAALNGGSFALLLHGTQPKDSDASKALKALKGKGSYSRNKKGATSMIV